VAEVCGVVTGIVILALLFKPFFGDASNFWKCVRFCFSSAIFSRFLGDVSGNNWSEMQLLFWLFCGGLSGFVTYAGISRLLS
jgi:hypothetical protein